MFAKLLPRTIGKSASVLRSCGKCPTISRVSAISTGNLARQFHSVGPMLMARKQVESSLPAIIQSEIEEERSAVEIDPEFLKMKKQIEKKFQIVDQPGDPFVELSRKFGKETLTISFNCQDEETIDDNNYRVGEDDTEEEVTEDEEMPVGIQFKATLTQESGNRMVVSAIAGSNITVVGVTMVPAEVNEEEYYAGPPFENLAENLQEGIIEYLEGKGLDDDMSYFIVAYATHKEQNEYETWLHNILEFVEK